MPWISTLSPMPGSAGLKPLSQALPYSINARAVFSFLPFITFSAQIDRQVRERKNPAFRQTKMKPGPQSPGKLYKRRGERRRSLTWIWRSPRRWLFGIARWWLCRTENSREMEKQKHEWLNGHSPKDRNIFMIAPRETFADKITCISRTITSGSSWDLQIRLF